jgi:hypothetical protein
MGIVATTFCLGFLRYKFKSLKCPFNFSIHFQIIYSRLKSMKEHAATIQSVKSNFKINAVAVQLGINDTSWFTDG